jgi:hypothetical protein
MEQLLLDTAKGQGPYFIMFCIALYWMQSMNKGLIVKLNEERNEHLNALGEQIRDLKEAIIDCERDRKELWSRILEKNQ